MKLVWLTFLFRIAHLVKVPEGFGPMPDTPDKYYRRMAATLFAWDAVKECARLGATLPRFEDKKEYSAVMQIISAEGDPNVWIDLYNLGFYSYSSWDGVTMWGSGGIYDNATGILKAYNYYTFCFMLVITLLVR